MWPLGTFWAQVRRKAGLRRCAPPPSPLVGREEEIALLTGRWEQVTSCARRRAANDRPQSSPLKIPEPQVGARYFGLLLAIGIIDIAARRGFLTFLSFVLNVG